MTSTRLKPNAVSILVALVALVAATMLVGPAHAADGNTDIKRLGSVSEFEKYDTGSDEYKFTAEPADNGSVTIDVEPGEGQTLEVDSNGDLNFLDESGKKEFQLENLSAVAEQYPEAKIGNWKLTDSGARVQLSAPAEVQSAFEKSPSCNDSNEAGASLDTQSAYSNCMLENGIKYGTATAISTCVAGAFAAGVGCVAGILPGATGGYISGLVVGLWDCKDKL